MIIWQGRGFVAAVIPFGILLALNLAVDATGPRVRWSENLHWFLAIAAGTSALILRWLASRWTDPGRGDTLFFIPLRYWATIYGIGAAAAIVYGILDLLALR